MGGTGRVGAPTLARRALTPACDILDRVDKRWPGWVYDDGDEPDPRFSFANERTFLAWVRTALALLAGGVALHVLPLTIDRKSVV